MLTKQSQDFLEKLRVELLFRGKTEEEVEELLEELEDHLTMAEKITKIQVQLLIHRLSQWLINYHLR
ncbi:Uncharacterised protein [Staphylococcus aureus]|nr:Uncharacterised protein [Staphylococcus aureus]SGU43120.1 Uncharacterised protein [Staphylococcus aureus]